MKRTLVAFLLLSLGVARSASADPLMSLRLSAVHDLVVNKTVVTIPYVNEDISDPRAHFETNRLVLQPHPDQTLAGRFLKEGEDIYSTADKENQDTGIWRFKKSGAFCMKWAHWYHQEELCTFWYAMKNGYLVASPSQIVYTFVEKSQVY